MSEKCATEVHLALERSSALLARSFLVRALVLLTLFLCMTAPEQILVSTVESGEQNPLTGFVKFGLIGCGLLLILFCSKRTSSMPLLLSFAPVMGWATLSWIAAGAQVTLFPSLVNTFGGLLVVTGLSRASYWAGGIRGVVRLAVLALILCVLGSLLLGVLGLQLMPGQTPKWRAEMFHGIGHPWFAVAGCALLVAWVLGHSLVRATATMEVRILLLLVIPAMVELRAFLIGILAMIVMTAILMMRKSVLRHDADSSRRLIISFRLCVLVLVALTIGSFVVMSKTALAPAGRELSGRELVWPLVLESIRSNPLLGLGPYGDVGLLKSTGLTWIAAAHSDYLAIASSFGIPGLVFWLGGLASVFWKVLRHRPHGEDQQACRYAATLSLVAFMTTMLAENVCRDPRLFSLYLLFPALCLGGADRSLLDRGSLNARTHPTHELPPNTVQRG